MLLNTVLFSFYSPLSHEQSRRLEGIQRSCVKVILDDDYMIYICYQIALEMFRLASLNKHRQERCLEFSLKFSKHPANNILFPRNLNSNNHSEEFLVNSAIPYCQPILNEHFAAKS